MKTINIISIVIGIIIICSVFLWGCPQYSVYSARKNGEAILAKAESSRKVAIAEANAKKESATLLAQADTIRAHGVARSNAIIGESLKNNEAYLKWLWIDQMDRTQNQIIYVPTESNIPLMEAGRITKTPVTEPNP